MYNPCLNSGELCSTSLKANYSYKSFGISLHRWFVSSPYSFIYSHIYISVDSWVLFQLSLLRFLTVAAVSLSPSSHHCFFSCCLLAFHMVFSISLVSGTKKCSMLILCNSCLYSWIKHFSNELKFLLLENSIGN